jgi:hypothetical protein
MSDVKRFSVREFCPNANGGRSGEATPPYTDIECVQASDYDALAAERDRLRALLGESIELLREIAGHPYAHEADCDYEILPGPMTVIVQGTCNCGCEKARAYLAKLAQEGIK